MVEKPIHKEFEQIVDKRYQIENLINMDDLRKILDDFHKIAPFPVALLNLDGEVLLESHWEPICTQFHRVHPKTAVICTESDIHFNAELAKGDKRHILYNCANGLYDAASPIIIEGQHLGNFFIGQFLLEPPDEGFFRKQAQRYGFEEEEYLEALSRVPIISEYDLNNRLDYLCGFAEFLGNVGLKEFQRDRAEEALRESKERLRIAGKATYDLIYEWNVPNDALEWFGDIDGLLGYEPGAISRDIGAWLELIHPEDRGQLENAVELHRTATEPIHYEYRIKHRDGTYRHLRDHGLPMLDKQGHPYKWIGVCADITDRKQAEEALRESEAQYRGIFNSTTDSFLIFDHKGNIIEANPQACKMYGYSYEELIQLSGKDLVHSDCYQIFDEFKRAVETKREYEAESIDIRKDGTPFNIKVRGTGFDHKGKPHLLAVIRDVTEEKQAEETLLESEEKYRTILESIEDGYFEVDIAGNFTFFNDSLCKILGYSKDELMGINNRQYTDEESAKKLYQTFNKVYTTGKPDKGFGWKILRKDETKILVEASVSLRSNAGGEPIGFRGIVRDISEKQRLEAQLQQAQRMESIGTLAGGIAHNFNNLLMGIQGNASIILLDIDSGNPRHKNLKNIEKLVENGAKLTSQLIGYAREGSYEVKPISLNQLVKETSDTFGMTKKEITVHQELSEELYGIKADQGQIEQVLLNLYVNAADAMPGGGDLFLKTINVADKDITGKPYEVKPGNYVLLTVRDTGVGMDKETRDRIFEPFFTTKGLASGTGLGMASAYGIIKGHGGYINVDSKIGEGTTFSIYLPATEKVIKEKKVLSDKVVKGKGIVLLVDDEEMVLEAGEVLLNHLGYEVLLAENGQEALDLYKKHRDKIDLVLLDMVMPVMGGGEAFDRMKEINTNVKVLLSSGYSLEGEAKEILKRGCDAFIQKPFKTEQLSQKIQELLHKR